MLECKTFLAGVLLASLTTLASAEQAAKKDQLIATVNGVKITTSDMNTFFSSQPASERPRTPQGAVAELINRELLKQEALKQKLDKEESFKKMLDAQRTNLLVNALLAKRIKDIDLSDKALKKEYDEKIKKADLTEYKARHILVKDKKAAEDIIKQLKDGADFQKLAKEKSTGPSANSGGDLGWFSAATMVPEFSAALKKMKKGQFSETPVKTQFGWHVILLEDSRKREAPPFDKVKPQLKQSLTSKAIHAYIDQLTRKADIKINTEKEKK